MKKAKFIILALVVTLLVITQFAMVSAAPSLDKAAFVSGTVKEVTLSPDQGTVQITLIDDKGKTQTVIVDLTTADDLGLLWYDDNGPHLVETLPESLEIQVDDILTDEIHHPVANALATYFKEIEGVDYGLIVTTHESGYGFGVIAQGLWLTQKLGGDADTLAAILEAKKTGNYNAFKQADGTSFTNWGQFKKAILDKDKKDNLGVVMSDKDDSSSGNHGNGGGNSNANDNGNNQNKDKNNNGNNGNNANPENNGNNGNNGNKDNNGNKKP